MSGRFAQYNIPEDVLAAATLLHEHFEMRGYGSWELENVCSRNHAYLLSNLNSLPADTSFKRVVSERSLAAVWQASGPAVDEPIEADTLEEAYKAYIASLLDETKPVIVT